MLKNEGFPAIAPTVMHWTGGVAFLSAVWQVLIVSAFLLKYTVLVKDNQHLYAYLREEAF